MRILVVEDDADIRATLVDIFQYAGFDTFDAANGRAALDVLDASGIPDVILLDMLMPVMDGPTFLQALSASPTYGCIPVIVLSADTRIQPPGAVALVRKPFDMKKLLEVVIASARSPTKA